jgi:phosphate transport system permease protein
MSTAPTSAGFTSRRRLTDRLGDRVLIGLTIAASVTAIVVIVLIIDKLFAGASSSISTFGLGFLWHSVWNPSVSTGVVNANVYGAAVLIFGTVSPRRSHCYSRCRWASRSASTSAFSRRAVPEP